MNKFTSTFFVVFLLIVSMVPGTIAVAQVAGNAPEQIDGTDPNLIATSSDSESEDAKMDRCIAFLKANTKIENVNTKCEQILEKEDNCVEFLQNNNVRNAELRCQQIKQTTAARIHALNPEQQARITDENAGRIAEHVKDRLQSNIKAKKINQRLRTLDSKIKEQARERFERAQEKLQKNKERFEERREKFNEIKAELKVCKEDNSSEECEAAREEAIIIAKEHLANGIDVAIEHLTAVKAKIEGLEEMDQQEAEKLIAEITEEIETLEDIKTRLGDATTREEINSLAKETREIINQQKIRSKVHTMDVIQAKTGRLLDKLGDVEEKLICSAESIQGEASAANINELLEKLDEQRNLAYEKFEDNEQISEEIRSKLIESADNSEEMTKLANKLRENHKIIQSELKSVYKTTKSVLVEINKAGGKLCTLGQDSTTKNTEDDNTNNEENVE